MQCSLFSTVNLTSNHFPSKVSDHLHSQTYNVPLFWANISVPQLTVKERFYCTWSAPNLSYGLFTLPVRFFVSDSDFLFDSLGCLQHRRRWHTALIPIFFPIWMGSAPISFRYRIQSHTSRWRKKWINQKHSAYYYRRQNRNWNRKENRTVSGNRP